MVSDHANNRKHYRVYMKKNRQKSAADSAVATKKRMMLYGLVGIAFIKGLFWGYLLKGKRR
ncbi:MAG: hypothetical protein PWR27_620 [Petroclostridium sp.]|uniref:hypothetical protein n=1 Tax=Petroclostridium xylanilyticum TaxID=1792311 RepID=UPI000B9971DB|nr:hypothetical protein [Petroclostridium xylanilyticum]MBZ4644962.1 hypothetical protein [Clostridia bacterium]MDK2809911.1 hypothetical protein [Petroclostridium sp.]